MRTYTGEELLPFEPDADKINIKDIAHALSLMCRANGHYIRFFSVAQHSINCANEAKTRGFSDRIQLACLLHDASEAYFADIVKPVKFYKDYLSKYIEGERHMQDVIFCKFLGKPLTIEESAHVRQIDSDMLAYELEALLGKKESNQMPIIKSEPCYDFVDFLETENKFYNMFEDIIKGIKGVN